MKRILLSAVLAVALTQAMLAHQIVARKPEECKTTLIDGRRLVTLHLNGSNEHYRCVYEQPRYKVTKR